MWGIDCIAKFLSILSLAFEKGEKEFLCNCTLVQKVAPNVKIIYLLFYVILVRGYNGCPWSSMYKDTRSQASYNISSNVHIYCWKCK